jgi:hypothetical protein
MALLYCDALRPSRRLKRIISLDYAFSTLPNIYAATLTGGLISGYLIFERALAPGRVGENRSALAPQHGDKLPLRSCALAKKGSRTLAENGRNERTAL